MRRGDDQWTAVIRWTLNALMLGEELGVTKANVAALARDSQEPRTRRLLGEEGEFGPSLGLPGPGRGTPSRQAATMARYSSGTLASNRR